MPDVTTLSPVAVLVTVFVLSVLETSVVVGLVLPGEVLIAACIGVLDLDWWPVTITVAAAGCLFGQTAGYGLGRAMGPALQHSWIGRKTGQERLAQAEQLARETGPLLLISARFVAVVHTLAPVLAGTLRMPVRRFLWCAALSSTIWAVVWTAIGTALGQAGRYIDPGLVTTVFAVVGVGIATLVFSRVLRATRRQAAGEKGDDGDGAADGPPAALAPRSRHSPYLRGL